MSEGFSQRKKPFQDRRMWRLLLARLHPDAGGDHELFLFACAVMDSVCGGRRGGGRFHGGPGPDRTFSAWRGGMNSWASRNRDGLRRPGASRRKHHGR